MIETRPLTDQPAVDARFRLRRINPATDVPRLLALHLAVEAVDQVGDHPTTDNITDAFTEPSYDVAQDAWVVEDPQNPDRLIGENWTYHVANTPRAFVGALVHPEWRGQGLGGELLRRALDRARAQDSNHYVSSGCDDRLDSARRLLEHAGFRRVVGWVLMRLPADQAVPAPQLPPGYTIRPYTEVNDPAVVQTALNQGFIGHWENRDRPLEDIIHRLQGPSVRPAGILLAFGPAGDPAGICWASYNDEANTQRGEAVGHIDNLGVVPAHRRAGLGRALLAAGVAWLRAQDQAAIELDAMGNNELALPLYEGVGFRITRQGSEYRLDLA